VVLSTGIISPVNEACATVKPSDIKRTESPGKTSPPADTLIVIIKQK
jgi:hypothetical protein